MNGDHVIPSSFKAIVEECALRATEEDVEGIPEWERFHVISHEMGLLLYILAFATRRLRIAQLDGSGGVGSSLVWLAGAAAEVEGEVIGWEGNPRRLLKLQNKLSRARLSPHVGLSATDPLWEGSGGVIAPPEPNEGVRELDPRSIDSRFDCVVVSLTEADWARRISLGWELMEPDGLLILLETLQIPETADDFLSEFFETRAAAVVGIPTGEGMILAHKLDRDSREPVEPNRDAALVGDRAAVVLDELAGENRKPGSRLWAIPPETGRFLWILARAMGARNVLEVGASGGYSGVWLGSALSATGGRLTTMDHDPDKIALATESYRRAGVSDWVAILEGDAREIVHDLPGSFDFIFLDCDKEHYLELLDRLIVLLRPGGLLVSDNMVSHKDELRQFADTVQHHPNLASVTVGIGSGVEVTLRL